MDRSCLGTSKVTKLDAFRLNGEEYWKRFCRTFWYGLAFIILILLIALLAAFVIKYASSEGDFINAFKSTSATAADVATPINIDENGVHANSGEKGVVVPESGFKSTDSLKQQVDENRELTEIGASSHFDIVIFFVCLIEAFMIMVIGIVFSGASAAVFLTPINPIKFAPFVILDRDTRSLMIRLWVCYPNDKYLHNVKVSIRTAYKGIYENSALVFRDCCNDESKTNVGILKTQSYEMMRGVWQVEIALDSRIADEIYCFFENEGSSLEKSDGSSPDLKNRTLRIIVRGETDSGEYVSSQRMYGLQEIIDGYEFAPYDFPSNDPSLEDTPLNERKPWFINFCQIIKLHKEANNESIDSNYGNHHEKWSKLLKDANSSRDVETASRIERCTTNRPSKWNPSLNHSACKFIQEMTKES